MRTLALKGSTNTLSVDDLWSRISNIDDYPQAIKFCQKVESVDAKAGGYYIDTTTLLWVPFTIEHHITHMNYHEEVRYFLPLPLGGKMWHVFKVGEEGGRTQLEAEITFDLGNAIFNHTVGRVLKRRLRTMCIDSFPEFTVAESR
jgi:ribosome-associated toxin RatA of RatAB toxin-antitoxin module